MKLISSNKNRSALKLSLFVAAGVLFAAASLHGVRADSKQPSASKTGVWMTVSHKVYNYDHWKRVHDRTAAIKRGLGWKQDSVFLVDGDRNHVMVMEQFDSLERARAFSNSNELRDEMAASGVSSQPEIHFVNALAGEAP